MRSSEEARAYMEELRTILRYIGVCDGNLEEGSMRCDANISVRPIGQKEFGVRAEIKNVNSFKALQRAIEYEIDRQIDIVEAGEEVVQETRLWDDNEGITKSMRGKEDAHDYRYFPEPDLMPLEISREWVNEIASKMPELPQKRRERYVSYGLSAYDANILVEQQDIAYFYDKAVNLGADAKTANNFLMKEIAAYLKEEKLTIEETKLTPENFAQLINMVTLGEISNNIGKQIVITLLKEGGNAKEIVEKQGLSVISDENTLKSIVNKVIENNPSQVQLYRGGKDKLFGFFVGQVMKETQGRANPQLLNKLLKSALDS